MSNRNNTLLIKRSNVVGKVPSLSGLTLGELALNTADVRLYSLYTGGDTGSTEVRQIGWDRLSISGGTLYGQTYYSFGTGWTQNQTVSYISAATGNVLVTKEWVESLSFDDSTSLAVNVATTAVLPSCTYNNGTGGIGATLTRTTSGTTGSIDGITVGLGDRILVKNQVSQIQNGVYEVTVVGSVSVKFVLTRTSESNETSEFDPQIVIPTRGTQAGLRFAQTTADPVIGVSNIVYTSVGNTTTFVTQSAAGTQTPGNIPFWTSTARDLSKGLNTQLFWDNTNKRFGINTGTPSTTLEVSGKTKTINFQMTSGATAGYVLSSDSSGNATWIPGSSISGVTSLDTFVTGFTYSNNNLTINQNGGQSSLNVNISVMSGLTVSNNTNLDIVTASSISNLDYIIFNTGSTITGTTAGTVYFDNVEKALSYNTSINQGVTVNLGQQNYVRVFNNSGTDIQRGKALEILSAYNGLPSVTLAINKHEGFSVIGMSAEIIPNNTEGIVITSGIISNIELTGMTVGSLMYASDSEPGKLDSASKYLSFPLTARTNSVGYVVQTGDTTGKLFVTITNENSVLSLTDLERNVLEGNTLSTGLFEFTGMTTASTTTFNVAPLKGWLVKNTYEYALTPDVQSVNYTGGNIIPVTNIATADSTYILITSALTVTQQVTFPTPQQRRENIFLGKINHPNRTSILNINNTADYDVSPMSSLRDLWSPIKLINQGIIPSPNGANLSFNTSAGILWGNGINWHNNQLNPNSVSISGKTPASFFYRTQTGGTSSSVTVIDPRHYDVGGVITSVGTAGSNDATNQRIYLYPTGVINVLYGQTRYATLSAAIAAIQSETFIPYPNAESTGILIGVISVRNDIGTDGEPLTNPDYAKFTLVSKFGESFGGTGGLSTTTLQQAYNNSTNPEIVTNSTLNSVQFRGGTGSDTDKNISIENNAGSETAYITAGGGGVFDSLSATTYYNLPTTISPAVNLFNYYNFI